MQFKTVRDVQLALLEIAKDVDALCRKHQIPYFLASGNLLGAVRHGGFIPWDDDLDIYLMPNDFLRLRELIKSELIIEKPHYFLYNDYRPSNFGEYLADSRFVWNYFYPIKIDFLLLKSLPNKQEVFDVDFEKVKMLAFLFNKERGKGLLCKDQTFVQKVLYTGSFWKRRERYIDAFHHYVYQNTELSKEHVYQFDYSDIFTPKFKESYSEEDFLTYDMLFPPKEILFEGCSFFAPNDVHGFLVKNYGENYMTPPTKEKQIPEHTGFRKAIFPKFITWNVRILYWLKMVKNSVTLVVKIKQLRKNNSV